MKNAYALLGLSFLIVFGGAYMLVEKVHAPYEGILEDNTTIITMKLTSSVFAEGERIPTKYTCDGENISPPFLINGVPEGTQSLVLMMDDSDIPKEIKEARSIEKFDHLVAFNIDPTVTTIEEDAVPATFGTNSAGTKMYTGPCPPTQYEPTEHRYIFKLYAIDEPELLFETSPSYEEVMERIKDSILEEAELMGRYSRVTE